MGIPVADDVTDCVGHPAPAAAAGPSGSFSLINRAIGTCGPRRSRQSPARPGPVSIYVGKIGSRGRRSSSIYTVPLIKSNLEMLRSEDK